VPEVIIDGETGILVAIDSRMDTHEDSRMKAPKALPAPSARDFAAAFRRLLEDEALRAQMGKKAAERAQDAFSQARVLPQFKDVLARVATQAPSKP
jgi:glycosyltransferase involved in cell wall biosynthesis